MAEDETTLPGAEPEDNPADTAAAIQDAARTLAAATQDPLRMAQENAELRSSLRGSYVLIRALMKEFVGTNKTHTIPRAEWQAPDPNEHLVVDTTDEGDATLVLKRRNRAERRRLTK